MKKSKFFIGIIALTLAACLSPSGGATPTPPPTNTPEPTALVEPVETSTPQAGIPEEIQARFDELRLDPKEGVDQNGNPIYFVTNPAGEQVTVAQKNNEGKWELADSTRYKLYATVEEAEASGVVMDTEYVLRGGPGQAAKLNGQPFPEDVLTGLDVIVTEHFPVTNVDHYYKQLNFGNNDLLLLNKYPERAPYENMGWFVWKNIVNGEERTGYGCVWQWRNPDGSLRYNTIVFVRKISSTLEPTPFATFDSESADDSVPIIKEISHNKITNGLLQLWADTNIVPVELQDRALVLSYRFK